MDEKSGNILGPGNERMQEALCLYPQMFWTIV